MKKLNKMLRELLVCLVTVICLGTNFSTVANATEVEAPADEQAATEARPAAQAVATTAEGSSAAIVEVQDYTIEGGMIEAGKEITVNLTLHNTSSSVNASSTMMTLSNSTGSLYPAYGKSNQIYVGNISAGNTKVVSVPMTIGSNFAGDAIDLTCRFDYASQNARLTNTAMIVIPISGGNTIGVKSINVSSHAIVNGKSLLTFSYVNQSSSNITDAKLSIEGNVSSASKEISLDTVYAGKAYTQDFYVTFKEPGNQAIKVTLQYTDVDGEVTVTDLGTFDVTVSKQNVEEENNSQISFVVSLIGKIVAMAIIIFAAAVMYVYIKKKVF
ncbi:hypothetical protein [Pseudobutyrivibrio xylanivorans]|uniref:Uncharacterized protein n=1 Tax=Pseudobutyrivibrio xylanivorans TaxID=185007 RepID=A0A1G5S0M3_PSEXY|nr:hypothetical protein [Pseudobutyrivibrio xylanivorans]SCZ79688.1 hypothetical protein SAMN02910350_01899 [Pseudobutyrivibrio xylanivorans]